MKYLMGASLLLLAACQAEKPALPPPPVADPARGRQLVEQLSCNACHVIPGIEGPRGRLGPSLEHVSTRKQIGDDIENTPENMARWIRNPQAFDPANTMPALDINDADARDITAFLFTLK